MTNRKRRVEKLETGLTPAQAILLWLHEAHSFHGIKEYARDPSDKPDSEAPIDKLTTQVADAVKQILKGQPREEINKAVRKVYRDVLFLFFLHQQVNGKLLTEERYYWTKWQLLNNELYSLLKEQALYRQMRWNRIKVGLEMPSGRRDRRGFRGRQAAPRHDLGDAGGKRRHRPVGDRELPTRRQDSIA